MLQNPQILLFKEGTDSSQGKSQLISNINACSAIFNILKTSLGPRGMDKLIHTDGETTISNDGATIIKKLSIVHPAAKTLTEIATSQDIEIGDGTTTVVLLASEILKQSKPLIEENISPITLIKGFHKACEIAIEYLKEITSFIDHENQSLILEKCAATALTSKLIESEKGFFAKEIVQEIKKNNIKNTDNIVIKSVSGGSIKKSFIWNGIIFKKTFSYAGFEQQPKKILSPKIAILNLELELKSERPNAEIRVTPKNYQSIINAEWDIIYDKLNKIADSTANVVLSKLPIGDLATQFFADRDIFCAGRVNDLDIKNMEKATGGKMMTSLNDLKNNLGTCNYFEEKQIGNDRYNFFHGCENKNESILTVVIRGGGDQYIAETERSLHDAIMVTKNLLKSQEIIAGGGAIEMELSAYIRKQARSIKDKRSLALTAFAKALEIIPSCLAMNAGMDATDIVNRLRLEHSKGNKFYGVDIEEEGVGDMYEKFVWEPACVKKNALCSATEAACLILSVDETIKAPKVNENKRGNPMGRQF